MCENGTLPQSQQTTAGSSKVTEGTQAKKAPLTTEEQIAMANAHIEVQREQKRKEEEEVNIM